MVTTKNIPHFMIIGAQKSGTTWLVDMLRDHSGVFIPRDEIHYYNTNYAKGIKWYRSHFEPAAAQLIGEKTPDYLGGEIPDSPNESIAERIKQDAPNSKLIVVLRSPVDRAISAYNHYVRTQKISPLQNPSSYFLNKKFERDSLGIVHYGNYDKHLKEYQERFEASSLLVLYYEDMMQAKQQTMEKVCAFLGIPAINFPNLEKRSNAFKKSKLGLTINYYMPFLKRVGWQFDKILPTNKQDISAEARNFLQEYYEETIEALESQMGYVPKKWRRI